jgi:hypothetical protein
VKLQKKFVRFLKDMTLITNYFNKENIIIASDKRRTLLNKEENLSKSKDDAIKLLHSSNYVVGVNGVLATKNCDLLKNINQLVLDYENIIPSDFVQIVKSGIVPLIENNNELNLTISGVYSNELFSFYYKAREDILIDCMTADKENIRFNGENMLKEKLCKQGFRFIRENLRNLKLVNIEDLSMPRLSNFNLEKIIVALKWMYEKFNNNDNHYYTIGGKMDYCIIHKNGKIEKYIN